MPPLDLYKSEPTNKPESNAQRLLALEMQNEELWKEVDVMKEQLEFMREQFRVMQQLLIRLANERISESSLCNPLPDRKDKEG